MTLRLAALGPSLDDDVVVLFADEAAVRHLSEQLRRLDKQEWSTPLGLPLIAEKPALRRLILRPTDTGLRVALEGDALLVGGDPVCLRRLAEDLDLYADHNNLDEPGMHCHVDRSDHTAAWIAVDSLPLMVAGWVSDR